MNRGILKVTPNLWLECVEVETQNKNLIFISWPFKTMGKWFQIPKYSSEQPLKHTHVFIKIIERGQHQWIEVCSSVQFSCSVVSDSLQPHGPQHARPPCPSPMSGVYPKSCSTLYNSMDCSVLGSPVFHYLLEFAQIHVLWVSDAI